MTALENVWLLVNERIEANRVDPDQTAPTGATLSRSTLFVEWLQTTQADDLCCIGTLRVNKCMVSISIERTHVCAIQSRY